MMAKQIFTATLFAAVILLICGGKKNDSSRKTPALVEPGAAKVSAEPATPQTDDLAGLVEMFMGVKAAGQCVVGPRMPFGSIHPSPDTKDGNSSGYNVNRPIRGFSQMHVSGTGGGGNYGFFLLSPQIGLTTAIDGHDSEKSGEQATPFKYSVDLDRYGIKVEIAPTHHAAIYRISFPDSNDARLLLDCSYSVVNRDGRRGAEDGKVEIDDRGQITGWGRFAGGWIDAPVNAYFAAQVSENADAHGVFRNDSNAEGQAAVAVARAGDRFGLWLKYRAQAKRPIYLKIAVSLRSTDCARRWLDSEIPDWDFERVASAGRSTWNRELSRITVSGGSLEDRRKFISNLYHCSLMPCDRTGDGPAQFGDKPYWDDHYATWDTWRSLFPLMTLINPEMVRDNINSYIERFKQYGMVDDAFVGGNGCGVKVGYRQGGDDPDNVIVDAFVKHLPGIDWEAAYAIIKHGADKLRDPSYLSRGWVDFEAYYASCSYTLEFAYNDYCASVMAGALGHGDDAEKYKARSRSWMNLWDEKAAGDGYRGFIQPRRADGSFERVDPKKWLGYPQGAFGEGSAWVYSFFMPHDFPKLISLCGGPAAFAERLVYGIDHNLIDFTNEPSFLTLRAFTYAGRPDLTSYYVHKALRLYTLDGPPGDDDSGSMGSWYVLSAIGLFPNAGTDLYLINAPLFPRVQLKVPHGIFEIQTRRPTEDSIYIQSASLNGQPLDRAWLRYDEIIRGGKLEVDLGPAPSAWGQKILPPQ
jgi:predicted alpha-1,2-mannosidase